MTKIFYFVASALFVAAAITAVIAGEYVVGFFNAFAGAYAFFASTDDDTNYGVRA